MSGSKGGGDAPDTGRGDASGGGDSSDDDNGSAPAGIMGFLKSRFGGGPSESVAKPKASSKPPARATAKATSKPATRPNTTKPAPKASSVKKATAAPVVKEVVGNAGGGAVENKKIFQTLKPINFKLQTNL